ncbi:MAG: serine/threonine-protein phosphatase [Planctomycetes bacterium]|nr:serine/threonine-protein phosphatase [Planctomycetota bacterium]MBI3846878.1 serine/threonine-protein phosphatase [Planctomycetota bacterium]
MVGSLGLEAYGDSVRGGRPSNQDAFVLLDTRHPIVRARGRGSLFAVADGLGGHAGGAEAARIAVDSLAHFFDTVREFELRDASGVLREVVLGAHRRICERGSEDASLEGMGTTVTVARFHGGHATFVHAGDSSLFQLRGDRLVVLTEDHTVASQLRRAGRLTEREYRSSPFRHSLFSYLGAPELILQVGEVEVRPGDRFLLATDGLLKSREERSVLLASRTASTPREWVRALLSRAARSPDADNTTAVAVFVGEVSNGGV